MKRIAVVIIFVFALVMPGSIAWAGNRSATDALYRLGLFGAGHDLDNFKINNKIVPHPDDSTFLSEPALIDSVHSTHGGLFFSYSRLWLFNQDRIGFGLGFDLKFHPGYLSRDDMGESGANKEVKFPDDARPDENASFAYADYQPWIFTPAPHLNLYFSPLGKSFFLLEYALPYHVHDELTVGYYRHGAYQKVAKYDWNGFGKRLSLTYAYYNAWADSHLHVTLYREWIDASFSKIESFGVTLFVTVLYDLGGK